MSSRAARPIVGAMRVGQFLIPLAVIAVAAAPLDRWAAMVSADERLGAIAYRLTTANAGLCRVQAPATGLVLHAIGQYPAGERARLRGVFEAPVAVEAVVAGSPADRAGVRAGDAVTAVAGRRLGTGAAGAGDRDAALAAIAGAGEPLRLTLLRGGVEREVVLAPVAGCRAEIEAVVGGGLAARADGKAIQVGDGILARYDDEDVAVVVAHELAHIVLGHHDRLAGHGGDAALVRASEDEADRVSVVLLYNAGYDPLAAARFWRAHGGDVEGGPFARRRHARPGERAALLERAAATIPAGAARPFPVQ